ncbi:MAG: hypothetical protein IJB55_05085, partial [Firmicutes bacterium]|nr:hypothetical protein [Bacillota bacterium]
MNKCGDKQTAQVIKVGLIGLGTVGGGTLDVLVKNRQIIAERAVSIEVTKICNLDIEYTEQRIAELGLANTTATRDYHDLLN